MMLLDTHVLIWLRSGDRRLGSRARQEVERGLVANDVAASAITFWEIGLLRERGRIELDHDVGEWRRLLLREGLSEIPVDGAVAVRAAGLTGLHRDPADRLILATALQGHRLVTADERMLDWSGRLRRIDARE